MDIVKLDIKTITQAQFEQMVMIEQNCGLEPYTPDMLQECITELDTYGCFDNGNLVGFITLNPSTRYLGGGLYIVNLNVAANYRRKGIAQRMILTACSSYTSTHAGKLVILDVAKDNVAAVELYMKLGFTISDQPSRNGDTDVVMTIPLDKLTCGELLMRVECVWEHNENDTLLYAVNLPGAYARGASKEIAVAKMEHEVRAYMKWKGCAVPETVTVAIIQDAACSLDVCDADSNVLFAAEREPLTYQEYSDLKALALKSAADFLALYESIPDKNKSSDAIRKTFYGQVPRTADEMYKHTKNVNEYYFGEIEVDADNEGTILDCRRRGFEALEAKANFLDNPVIEGSYGEDWTLRKILRRFLWHDRIHAKAMYRMAVREFGSDVIPNVFEF